MRIRRREREVRRGSARRGTARGIRDRDGRARRSGTREVRRGGVEE